LRVGKSMFSDALSFLKDERLQKQVVLTSFTLDVIDHVSQLYVSIEAKNRHKKRKNPIRRTALADMV